jgi:hypothetical protein
MPVRRLDEAIKSPNLKHVLRHWAEVKRGCHLPGWNDIRPSRIVRQLPMVWSYTYDRGTDSFTGRLAGDHIESIFGLSFRGRPLSEIFPSWRYGEAFSRAKRVVDGPALHRGEGVVFRMLNKFGYGERIMLPLAADGCTVDGILGCTDYSSYEANFPCSLLHSEEWFDL